MEKGVDELLKAKEKPAADPAPNIRPEAKSEPKRAPESERSEPGPKNP
jgi:hypothetical protein